MVDVAQISFRLLTSLSIMHSQIWSNGRYKSAQNRAALNSTPPRYSLIFFKNPRPECIICAPSELVNEAHPRKYKAVTWTEYVGIALQKLAICLTKSLSPEHTTLCSGTSKLV